jgi:UDP-N-acetylmuramyl pentapeptide phosphotransferase/UDP-N-acetylglucosamine-1-phosphate transferase
MLGDIRITSFYGIFGIQELSLWMSYAFSFFVAIVVVNSINLIDGIDGLASGMVAILSLFVGVYFYFTYAIDVSFVAFALSGALWVFFYHNVFGKSTKLFMGDSGSLFCGYMVTYFLFPCKM